MATNRLLGLLGSERACARGHGQMEQQPGVWALHQVNVLRDDKGGVSGVTDTGGRYAATLFRCPVCKMLELVDEGW